MKYITFDEKRPMDLVLLGRIAVDFNPVDYFQPLEECTTFRKYVGGSPANIAVGVVLISVGLISGTVSIVTGALLLKRKSEITF